MAHIARLAGVSVTTVSHVVNKTRVVKPETEQAVLAAIAQTGYVSDLAARSLRKIGPQTVGVAMSAITNVYFGEVVHGIESEASAAGFSLLLADTHDDVADEMRVMTDLLGRGVEAIILAPSGDPSNALASARHRGVPVTLIDRLMEADVDQIGPDNREPTDQLVSHLADLGHRRIGMISGKLGLSTTVERVAGYCDALRRYDLREAPELIVSGDSGVDGADHALRQLLALPDPPTAVVAGNNRMTIGAMRAARGLGVQVPKDLALVAFDDFEWADLFQPRLTVIAQPTTSLGAQAFQLVLSRIEDPGLPPRRVVMRPALVHRESCGCPPAS
jgi:LacI family transcriptional regulator